MEQGFWLFNGEEVRVTNVIRQQDGKTQKKVNECDTEEWLRFHGHQDGLNRRGGYASNAVIELVGDAGIATLKSTGDAGIAVIKLIGDAGASQRNLRRNVGLPLKRR